MSLSISQLLTKVVEELFKSGDVHRFGKMIAKENTKRVDLARDILGRWNLQSRDGVNFVWADIPDGWSGSTFMSATEAEGIMVAVADKFTLPGTPAPNAVRLTLSTTPDHETLEKGLHAIANILSNPPSSILWRILVPFQSQRVASQSALFW